MQEKFIFSYLNKDQNGLFRDLTLTANQSLIEFWPSHKQFKHSYQNIIKDIFLSKKINSFVTMPFQSFFYYLDKYPFTSSTIYHVIIPSSSICYYSMNYLEKLKQKYENVYLYALLTDSLEANSPHLNYVRDKLSSNVWAKVLTYDKYDAKKYGFTWFGYTYYSSFDFVSPSQQTSDLYFVGYDKGNRASLIGKIFDTLESQGVDCNFKMVSNHADTFVNGSQLAYTRKKQTYPEVVADVKSSKCILEVLQEHQQAQSIRYFEAIVYNKKLLTNNVHIKELPYYDPRYMYYFQSVDDIDPCWIKSDYTVDYKYHGEFSPVHLVDFIKQLEKEKV